MKKLNFTRGLYLYYFFTLAIIILSLCGGLYYFWNNGAANISKVSEVYEVTAKLDSINKKNEIIKIKKFVSNDKIKESLNIMSHLVDDLMEINNTAPLSEFDILEHSFKLTELSLNDLVSFPSFSMILSVFRDKMKLFEALAMKKKWKALTRISRRILAKTGSEKIGQLGYFKYKKLKRIIREIKKDIKLMKKLTENSTLDETKKGLILNHIINLEIELKMTSNYLIKLKKFYSSYKVLSRNYKKWLKIIIPEISLSKIQMEKNSRKIMISFGALVGFILISLIMGHFFHQHIRDKNGRSLEDLILAAIKEKIIPYDKEVEDYFSQSFRKDFHKLKDYIHQRMSFGTVFQEAIPFSSILLDSNLNVVWANSLFYENWDLGDYRGHHKLMTWDYLQRFTNLGENDPVLLALNQQVAGIYQIQVKKDEKGESLPYEMYVSPVDYGDKKRIMIFFYPLRSLEETISNQMKAVVGPISKAIEAMSVGKFNVLKEKIESDFKVVGITHLYIKMSKFEEFLTQQRTGLNNEMERLENELYDQLKLLDDLKILFQEKKCLHSETIKKFDHLKKNIVAIVELRNEIEGVFNNTASLSKELHENEHELIGKAEALLEVNHDNLKSFKSISIIRDDFKNLKNNIDHYRSNLSQSIEQSLVLQKTKEMTPEIMNKILDKAREQTQILEEEMAKFNKISRSFDIGLSKVQLMIEKNERIDLAVFKKLFKKSKDGLVDDIKAISEFHKVSATRDDLLIKSLKDLYTVFKKNGKSLHLIDSLVIKNRKLATNGLSESQSRKETRNFEKGRREIEV